jgi:hypothetical protein
MATVTFQRSSDKQMAMLWYEVSDFKKVTKQSTKEHKPKVT